MSNLKKSEILFLYESTYNIPNGDPFTGEQRYYEETKKNEGSVSQLKLTTTWEDKTIPSSTQQTTKLLEHENTYNIFVV